MSVDNFISLHICKDFYLLTASERSFIMHVYERSTALFPL